MLHEAGNKDDVDLFISKIWAIYEKAKTEPHINHGHNSDLHNWFAFIPKGDPRLSNLLKQGLESNNASVRSTAYFFIDPEILPRKECLEYIRKGLTDLDDQVRLWSASFFRDNEMSTSDWEAFILCLKNETSEENRNAMNKIIDNRTIHPQ